MKAINEELPKIGKIRLRLSSCLNHWSRMDVFSLKQTVNLLPIPVMISLKHTVALEEPRLETKLLIGVAEPVEMLKILRFYDMVIRAPTHLFVFENLTIRATRMLLTGMKEKFPACAHWPIHWPDELIEYEFTGIEPTARIQWKKRIMEES